MNQSANFDSEAGVTQKKAASQLLNEGSPTILVV